jgi:hypothetical protein
MNAYLLKEWPSILVLVGGVLLVGIFLCLHLVLKPRIVQWIAKYIFRNNLFSEKSAEGLFNVAVSFIGAIGGIWIIFAIYFLTNAA